MSRSRTVTITLGSLAAGAALATGLSGIAMAADTSPSPSSSASAPSGSSAAPDASPGQPGAGRVLDGQRGGPRDGGPARSGGMHGAPGSEPLHGEMVVQAADGTVSTVRMIRGTVTAVSSTSITVKADDGYSATYAVDSSTVVHSGLRGDGRPGHVTAEAAGSITDVAVGDVAHVHGTVTGSAATATRVHSMTADEAAQVVR